MKTFKQLVENAEVLEEEKFYDNPELLKTINLKLNELGFGPTSLKKISGSSHTTDKKLSQTNVKIPDEFKTLFRELHCRVSVSGSYSEDYGVSCSIKVTWDMISSDGIENRSTYYCNCYDGKWTR